MKKVLFLALVVFGAVACTSNTETAVESGVDTAVVDTTCVDSTAIDTTVEATVETTK
jgi:uncharacterized protein YcfL